MSHSLLFRRSSSNQNEWHLPNRIEKIEFGSFSPLNSLEWLFLNGNQLRSLPYETFHPLLSSSTLAVFDIHSKYQKLTIPCNECLSFWSNQIMCDFWEKC